LKTIHGNGFGHSTHPQVPFIPKPLSYVDDLIQIPDLDDEASILEETKNFLNQKHSPFDLLSLGLGTFQDRLDFMPTTQINKNPKTQTNLKLKPTPNPNSNPHFTKPQHISHPLGVIRDFGFLLNDDPYDIFTKNDDPNNIFTKNNNPNPFLNINDPLNDISTNNLDFLKQDPLDFTNYQKLESNLNEEDQEFLKNSYKEGLEIKEELEKLLGESYSFLDDSPAMKGFKKLKHLDPSLIDDIPGTTPATKGYKHFISRPNYSIRF